MMGHHCCLIVDEEKHILTNPSLLSCSRLGLVLLRLHLHPTVCVVMRRCGHCMRHGGLLNLCEGFPTVLLLVLFGAISG